MYPNIELSLVGQNLLADQHLEYTDETFIIPSAVYFALFTAKSAWIFNSSVNLYSQIFKPCRQKVFNMLVRQKTNLHCHNLQANI
jgi:hypothetical protein